MYYLMHFSTKMFISLWFVIAQSVLIFFSVSVTKFVCLQQIKIKLILKLGILFKTIIGREFARAFSKIESHSEQPARNTGRQKNCNHSKNHWGNNSEYFPVYFQIKYHNQEFTATVKKFERFCMEAKCPEPSCTLAVSVILLCNFYATMASCFRSGKKL
jgi:hypothetical protein